VANQSGASMSADENQGQENEFHQENIFQPD
jgi:hypothetical protein